MPKIKPHLQEVHTREQKKQFKEHLNNIVNVSPSIAEFIYTELNIDAATASNPSMAARLHLIYDGETDLIADLRHLNSGQPARFDVFGEKLQLVVEQVTAADDHRQNVAHLSEWLSVGELINQTSALCPDQPVPSETLVRLQFLPRSPCIHRALTFTRKLQVQYKIQRRQLRISQPDNHYCQAQLKYMKTKAVDIADHVVMVCLDDKAKVPIGDPPCPGVHWSPWQEDISSCYNYCIS